MDITPKFFILKKISKKEVLEAFEIRKRYEHLVSFAGKFADFKGIDVLLRANAIYDRDDTATILAGDGALFDEMTQLKNELGLKNTFFIRNQAHDKLRKLYSVANVSLIPSRNEPFGLVAIEAGACGAPVIVSKSGGLLDIVKPETGLFFEQENFNELANCIHQVLNKEISLDKIASQKKPTTTSHKTFSLNNSLKKSIEKFALPSCGLSKS